MTAPKTNSSPKAVRSWAGSEMTADDDGDVDGDASTAATAPMSVWVISIAPTAAIQDRVTPRWIPMIATLLLARVSRH
jgi:hypothetical protein